MKYSVIVPVYNEAKNLPVLVLGINSVMKSLRGDYEIIIVNDEGKDESLQVLDSLSKKYPALRYLHRTSNKGVGFAIRAGLKASKGDIIITLDGDLSHDPKEIPLLLSGLKDHDMVCGSRYTNRGEANMGLSRKIISGIFNKTFRLVLGLPVRDFTSGFRAYKGEIARSLELRSKTFGIFIEIPIKAHLMGYRITERPIHYHKRGHGQSNLNYMKQGPEYFVVALTALKQRLLNFLR